ncbi:MAG: SCO family protein [Caldilineaceae bacterium]|nr:SCO family protein [Caldilineaceae bacterium]HRJ41070.1 SCO family protein [Caldilineaceae bacterium]
MNKNRGLRLFSLLFLLLIVAGCTARHTFTALVFDKKEPVGEIRGVSHTDEPFDLADLRGRYVLIFFGYTFCPDVCPTTLLEVGGALGALEQGGVPVAESVSAVFVTVDPERDTPDRMAQYIGAFHPGIIGVVVDPSQLEAVKSSYGVYAAKSDVSQTSAAGYLMDHTAAIYVIDREGNLAALFSNDTPADVMAADMKALIGR